MAILLMAGLNIGLLLAPAFLMLLGVPAPPDVLNPRGHQDVMRDGAVAHIALASAFAGGLTRPSMRLRLWTGVATLLGVEAASIGSAALVLGGLAPLIVSTLLAFWACRILGEPSRSRTREDTVDLVIVFQKWSHR